MKIPFQNCSGKTPESRDRGMRDSEFQNHPNFARQWRSEGMLDLSFVYSSAQQLRHFRYKNFEACGSVELQFLNRQDLSKLTAFSNSDSCESEWFSVLIIRN